jgi:hypothetical protein
MDSNTKACIAFVVASHQGARKNSVYDHSQGKYIQITGAVTSNEANIYDHDRGCHFSGSISNLYDYGRSAHVSLNMNLNQFNGFDYGDGHHYSGTINGSSVSIYDHGLGEYFSYTL